MPEISLGITELHEIFGLLGGLPQHLGLSPLLFTNSVWVLKYGMWKGCEAEPTVYRRYPKGL